MSQIETHFAKASQLRTQFDAVCYKEGACRTAGSLFARRHKGGGSCCSRCMAWNVRGRAATDGNGHVRGGAFPQNTGVPGESRHPWRLPLTTATPSHRPGQGPRRPPTGAARFTLALTGTGRRSTLPLGQTPLALVCVGSGTRPGALLNLLLGVGVTHLFLYDGYVGLYPVAHP